MKKYVKFSILLFSFLFIFIITKEFTYAQNDNTLGSIEELFPETPIQNRIVEGLSYIYQDAGINKTSYVTQEQLDKITEVIAYAGEPCHISVESIKNLHLLTNLKRLDFGIRVSMEDADFLWKQISYLKNLEELRISSQMEINRSNFKINVPYLPKLKKLEFQMWGISSKKSGNVLSSYYFDGSTINADNLPALETLVLAETPLKDYSKIGYMTNLKNLILVMQLLKDIKFIENLVNLEELSIQLNEILDFSPLKNLKNLKKLNAGLQTVYYAKENAITYYTVTNKHELPIHIYNTDGTLILPNYLTGYNFGQNKGSASYDANSKSLVLERIDYSKLSTTMFWIDKMEWPSNDGIVVDEKPYIPQKVELLKFNFPMANGLGNIDITIGYEIIRNDGAIPINNAPKIEATDKVITVGDAFDPLEGVSASDKEDGEIILTEANIVENNVNADEAGEYVVVIKVSDSKGATVQKKINVTVLKRNMTLMNQAPQIEVSDRVIAVGENFNPFEGVTVSDKEDGEIILTEANIVENNVNINEVGEYLVKLRVVDSGGAVANKSYKVFVINNQVQIPSVERPNNKPSDNTNVEMPKTGYDMSSNFYILFIVILLSSVTLMYSCVNRKK